MPLRERSSIRALAAERDPVRMLTGYATLVTEIHARIAPLCVALEGAAQIDPQAKELYERIQSERLAAMRTPAAKLFDEGALRPDLTIDMAADLLWLHNDPVLFDKLVRRRAWPISRYERWLAATLHSQLL